MGGLTDRVDVRQSRQHGGPDPIEQREGRRMRRGELTRAHWPSGDSPTADPRLWPSREDVESRIGLRVLPFEEQPLGLAISGTGPDQMPATAQLIAGQLDDQVTLL